MTNYNFESTNLLVFIYKWKKQLLILGVVAAIVSSVVSLLIQEKYKSTVIVFPASTSSISKALISENLSGKHDIMEFGEEEQAEQLLQVLHSDEIRSRIIEKYDLMNHYDIKPTEKYALTKLFKKYEDNVTYKRTKFQSVRIDVMDANPDTAAAIANDISALLDTVMTKMQQERAKKALQIVEIEYLQLLEFIKNLEDSMTTLRKLGVHEYEVQIEMYTKQYSEAIAAGKKEAIKLLEEKLDILAEYGSAYVSLRNKLEYETDKLTQLRFKYNEAKIDASAIIPHKFVVNNAFPAEKKSYPIRWLIVVVSTISTVLFGFLVLIIIENIKSIKTA
jgi:uncharacterized protein involved in exopolysaccharide biosynthesis